MGLGVPVVGTAVEGLPLTLGEGRGLFVAPEDPRALAAGIAAILRGEQYTDLDGGRAYAGRFEAGLVAEQYAAVYRRLIHPRQVGEVSARLSPTGHTHGPNTVDDPLGGARPRAGPRRRPGCRTP